MKILIVLGVGIALGFALKKQDKVKEPKIVIIDDRNCLGEYLFSDKAKEIFKKFYTNFN